MAKCETCGAVSRGRKSSDGKCPQCRDKRTLGRPEDAPVETPVGEQIDGAGDGIAPEQTVGE